MGSGEGSQTVRLIERYFQGTWQRYLTNEARPPTLARGLRRGVVSPKVENRGRFFK